MNRRRFLLGAGAVAGAAAAGRPLDVGVGAAGAASVPLVSLGAQPRGLPPRQHAWVATLSRDKLGDPVAPRFDRLLFFDVLGQPGPAHTVMLEAALRSLERRYRWGPSGLLFTVGWSPTYFQKVIRTGSPIPRAESLSHFEHPAVDRYHVCLHLACDDADRLAEIEAALVHGAPLSGVTGSLDISAALGWRETRTGFVGAGLPAAHQHVAGIPAGHPVARSAPLFMGFKSGLKKNQATEEGVTILGGPFAGGTTMHISYIRLRLGHWYTLLNQRERVVRMYAPQVTPEEVKRLTTDDASHAQDFAQAATHYGVVGHAQATARARRDGRPRIIRRDFNTVDGGHAGLHFVALQRTIEDFVTTRTAMNAVSAHLHNPAITDRAGNGINEYVFVLKRGNYILPTRGQRSFPLLPGRELAL